MNSLTLSLAYLRHRWLATVLNVVTFASGVALIVALLLISAQLQTEFSRNLRGIDVVVGARGSPLQMILSSVFHLDTPTGNILLEEADKIARHPLVKEALPVSIGDNYEGYRVVGTTAGYIEHYRCTLAEGKLFAAPLEAVIGTEIAEEFGLKPGDRFYSEHGLERGGDMHENSAYTVVGVLAPMNGLLDRLVLTSIESIWEVHDNDVRARAYFDPHKNIGKDPKAVYDPDEEGPKPREITALLVSYRSPMAAATLESEVNGNSRMQAANPLSEITRLHGFMGTSIGTLKVFGWFLIALAGFGIFVALYNAMYERRYDLALMRSFGASPAKLLLLMVNESLFVATAAALAGIAAGHLFVESVAVWLAETRHITITGRLFLQEETWLLAASMAIGVLAAILPAAWVSRIDIYKTLVRP